MLFLFVKEDRCICEEMLHIIGCSNKESRILIVIKTEILPNLLIFQEKKNENYDSKQDCPSSLGLSCNSDGINDSFHPHCFESHGA